MAGVNKATVLIVVRHFSDTRGARELFLGLARLGAASHFALGHVAGEAANVVLQDLVLVLQLVVIRLDGVNAFGEGLEGGLEGLGLSNFDPSVRST